MIRIFGTGLAALLGLAFGSFLNVCLSRWPEGEGVVQPRSHCRNCGRTLSWWENIPVASWIVLRGQCRTCNAKISWRYPLVELSVGALWGFTAWHVLPAMLSPNSSPTEAPLVFCYMSGLDVAIGHVILCWLLVALAVLDAENLWLPNWITFPGIVIGMFLTGFRFLLADWIAEGPHISKLGTLMDGLLGPVTAVLISAGLILLIRWTYWLIRRREGIGLGDAKLMALLGAWLGLSGALLSFAIGVMLGAVFALIVLAVPAGRRGSDTWLAARLPLGTFLCIGGIISTLWGQPIIAAYLRWAGL
ncbi:MAG TPA: prepilin peptidase [Terracidiphilus sp.]|jgi:leader peptidase (prepilin peptidase)/N-methyltransferase